MRFENGKEIPLWAGMNPPVEEGDTAQEPTITPYFPPVWKASRRAVVIFPGGGYFDLAEHEGKGYAEYFADKGYCCFVVKYRLGSQGYHHPAELSDAARAVRLVRTHADELGISPDRIGVMGSSAGAHLAATLGNLYEQALYAADEDKTVSSRPDWLVLCYPVITFLDPFANTGSRCRLMGDNPAPGLAEQLSCELSVTEKTPPSFIWHTWEDQGVLMENSLMYASALRKAGIRFELHIYEKGPHGIGLGNGHPWAEECIRWMDTFQSSENP